MMRSRPVDMGNWYLSELIILHMIHLTTLSTVIGQLAVLKVLH